MPPANAPIFWSHDPEERHVRAAEEYLSLLADASDASRLTSALRSAENENRAAKDLLRASGLPLLPPDNPHVARDLKAVGAGQPLSPVLLVRGDLERGLPLTIADGYHRLSACCHIDENAEVQCRIVAWDSGPGRPRTNQTPEPPPGL